MSESISIVVDGMNVQGEIVHRSGSDIEVRITSPYQGMSRAMHIPALCRINPSIDFRGLLGDETAVGLLKGLFLVHKFVEENTKVLKTRLVEMDMAIANLDPHRFLPDSAFREIRRDLRNELHKGRIDNKVYQQRLIQAKKRLQDRHREIWRIEGRLFQEQLPDGRAYSL